MDCMIQGTSPADFSPTMYEEIRKSSARDTNCCTLSTEEYDDYSQFLLTEFHTDHDSDTICSHDDEFGPHLKQWLRKPQHNGPS